MRTASPSAARRLCAVAGAVMATACLILAVSSAASAGSPTPSARTDVGNSSAFTTALIEV